MPQDIESLKSKLAAYEKAYENDEIMRSANANKGFKFCGMAVAEIPSIVNYTMSDFDFLNKALRQGGKQSAAHRPFEVVLISALDKSQSYDGLVKRGGNLPPAILAKHNVGDIVTYAAFIIKSKNGKYIGPLSTSPSEEEVLFKSGATFKILSRNEKKERRDRIRDGRDQRCKEQMSWVTVSPAGLSA